MVGIKIRITIKIVRARGCPPQWGLVRGGIAGMLTLLLGAEFSQRRV